MLNERKVADWDHLETKQALAALLRGDSDAAANYLGWMTWPLLVELTREAGCPTEGPLAWAIWRKSNYERDPKAAVAAMADCGYVPFQGYPLVRQVPVIQIARTECNCTDGSTIINYMFHKEMPFHMRPRAYERAMAMLKAEWPDSSRVYVGVTGQGYSVRCPGQLLPCACNT